MFPDINRYVSQIADTDYRRILNSFSGLVYVPYNPGTSTAPFTSFTNPQNTTITIDVNAGTLTRSNVPGFNFRCYFLPGWTKNADEVSTSTPNYWLLAVRESLLTTVANPDLYYPNDLRSQWSSLVQPSLQFRDDQEIFFKSLFWVIDIYRSRGYVLKTEYVFDPKRDILNWSISNTATGSSTTTQPVVRILNSGLTLDQAPPQLQANLPLSKNTVVQGIRQYCSSSAFI